MPAKRPEGPPPPPVVQKLRVRYAKRDRLRFTSHRDVARVLERAVRRSGIPIAFSAGFTPHPKISYVGAAPTGVASEAEYAEIGLAAERDPAAVQAALDAALPPGIDIVAVAPSVPGQALADLVDGSHWQVRLGSPDHAVDPAVVAAAAEGLWAAAEAVVGRKTKDGVRDVDVRAALVHLAAHGAGFEAVLRHTTPAVRPEELLLALHRHGLPDAPAVATRLAQGLVTPDGTLAVPL
ncbi:MAG TPA: TIGR03936 family radical SAM-associated protein [Mycobacteriales bacterium]|nr:TIGR03936 family radical SAM-associated protein [Mycobacteriales bacterium]